MSQRVVVVTGASAGIGRATAERFAESGDKVALLARNTESLDDLRRHLSERGARALAVPTDVSQWGQVDAAATRVEAELGPIDVWVNNAMVAVLAFVHETSPADIRRVMEVTYLGYVHGTLAALHRMRPRDRGTIVQVSSALAYRGIPLQSSYCAAKHAIKGFTETLRAELLHDNSAIRVTMVALPGVNTTQFGWVKTTLPRHPQPVPPIYQPEVAARGIHWAAAHPERRELKVGAPTVATIIGNKVAPTAAARYLGKTNVEAQMADQPISDDRVDNLYEPVPGLHSSHGVFDDRARYTSPQLWATTHRRLLAALAATGTLLAMALRRNPAS